MNWNSFVGISSYPESPYAIGHQDQLFYPSHEYGSYYGMRFEALFVAPFTGNYNFRIACDDICMMYLSTDATETNKQIIVDFRSGQTSSFLTFS